MPDGMNVNYDGLIPNNVAPERGRPRPQGSGDLASRLYRLVEGHGAGRLPGEPGLSAHRRSAWTRRAGPSSTTSGCPNTNGAFCWPPQVEGRAIGFGVHKGEPAWQEVPGEYRAMLRRLHGDPGRHRARLGRAAAPLGATAPSLYDMRNLFQVNVEEGRHLWAMVYLLAEILRRSRAARRPTTCCDAAPAMSTRRACSARSTRRRRIG